MPEADVDHIYDYPKGYIEDILKSVKTIAMVGASGDKTKFSYGVLRVLHETGYQMLPVNPNPSIKEIRGLKVFHSLKEIDKPVDMVQVFRRKEEFLSVAKEAIEIKDSYQDWKDRNNTVYFEEIKYNELPKIILV